MTKVSVVVATYKREESLVKALDSLAVQTYSDFEIVLVDDNGNPDWNEKVDAIVESFRQSNPQVSLQHITNNPNQGSAKTRNIGIAAATGKYVTFLDDDDVYLPPKLERQVTFMESGDLDYSVTDLFLYNEHEKLIDKRIRSYIKSTANEDLQRYHLMYHLTGTDTMMYTKEYLEKIGGFSPIDVGDEFYLMQRAIEGGGKFGYLEGCDLKAYVHTGECGGVSSGEGKIKGENQLYEYKKSFFDKINASSRRYIRMRHYAVIAFAQVRRKHRLAFVGNALKSFACAPIQCVGLLMEKKI